MTLYSYDHCPYCVKARMIFGFKDIPFHLVTLLNDDEETPLSMIGKKMLPILKKESGEYLPESLDIIAYVDGLKNFGVPIVKPSKKDLFLNQWLMDIRHYHYFLAMPRWPHLGLPEFKTESAQNYFTQKKEMSIGPFKDSLAQTDRFLKMAHDHLNLLEEKMNPTPYFWGETLNIDDFHLFSSLRCLTTVENFAFPPQVFQYFQWISEQSKILPHLPPVRRSL